MKRSFISILLLLLSPVLLYGAPAAAVEKKRSFGLRKEGTAHIQMRSLMAPIKKTVKSKRTKNSPVTVILTIADSKKVGKVCNKAPRINDALMGAWYARPIVQNYLYDRKNHSGKTDINYRRTKAQRKEDKRLVRIINKAIGSKEVKQILVLSGTMRMGGGAVTKLPFSSVNGCDELE
jgi:hypothetical protein